VGALLGRFRLRALLVVRTSMWLIPLLCLLTSIGLSFVTLAIDDAHPGLVPDSLTGTPTAAQTVLSTVGTAMMTLITLVLTVTTVAVQLAMGQFSPRIVRALLDDRPSQAAHGLFIGTFAFALLAIRGIDDQGGGTVPGVTVLTAYALVLASVVVLVLYVHHAGQGLRVAGLIDLVGDELRTQIDRLYPKGAARAGEQGDPATIRAADPGVVVRFDRGALIEEARAADCVLELAAAMGDYVPCDGALLRVHGDPSRIEPERVRGLVLLASERSHLDDPAYGFRKLADIGERGVSQPFNDPTTTVQAIDRLHDALRQLASREIPSGRLRDADGEVRLIVPTLDWSGYVRLAFDEIRLAGAGSPQVTRRLRAAIDDLKTVAPAERQAPLDRQLVLLTAGVTRRLESDDDVDAALTPDRQGIGSGPDVRRSRDGSPYA
jgi:uncharacterized membrane protein